MSALDTIQAWAAIANRPENEAPAVVHIERSALRELVDLAARLHEHSCIANQAAWKLGVALGHHGDDIEVYDGPGLLTYVDEITARLNATHPADVIDSGYCQTADGPWTWWVRRSDGTLLVETEDTRERAIFAMVAERDRVA